MKRIQDSLRALIEVLFLLPVWIVQGFRCSPQGFSDSLLSLCLQSIHSFWSSSKVNDGCKVSVGFEVVIMIINIEKLSCNFLS